MADKSCTSEVILSGVSLKIGEFRSRILAKPGYFHHTYFFSSLFRILRTRRKIRMARKTTVPPANIKFKLLLLPTGAGDISRTSTEHHTSSLHSHFWVQLSGVSLFMQTDHYGEPTIFGHARTYCADTYYLELCTYINRSYFPETCFWHCYHVY